MYKGTLKNGTAVAVKVQRPGILAEIALDLHVLRLATPFQVRLRVRGRLRVRAGYLGLGQVT